jgi:dihydroneopterin triphosphate diphosphatase
MDELPIKLEGILFSKAGDKYEFLILKRTPDDGDFWQPLTGTLKNGEKLEDCLLRELQEETGIQKPVNITNEVWRFDWRKGDYAIIEFVFGVEINRNAEITLSKDEHSEYKWCNFDEAVEMLGRDNNKKAFQEFKKKFLTNEEK